MARFKECRLAAGLPQKAVAIELAVKQPSISDWESGRTFPTVENLIRLADLYGVSVDYLLGRECSSDNGLIVTNEEKILILKIRTNPGLHSAIVEIASRYEIKTERSSKEA